jgi:peptidoglycan hydrolase-like protein with peptidoglycan-binding domain
MKIDKLQRCLNALYYGEGKLKITGRMNKETRKALKEFQIAVGVESTGELDEKTIKSFEMKIYTVGGYIDGTQLKGIQQSWDGCVYSNPQIEKMISKIPELLKHLSNIE